MMLCYDSSQAWTHQVANGAAFIAFGKETCLLALTSAWRKGILLLLVRWQKHSKGVINGFLC